MWSKEPDITNVLFNTQKDVTKCKFTQSMRSEEPGMTKVLSNTEKNVIEY